MNYRSIALLAIFTVCSVAVQAQEAMTVMTPEPPPPPAPTVTKRVLSIGPTGAYGIMLNGTDGFTLPEAPTCCSEYSSTSGAGLLLGVDFGIPVSTNIDIVAKLVYQSSSTTFTTDESVTVRSGNTTAQTALRHTLETSVGGIFLEPGVDWRVAGGLSLIGGLRLGTVLSGTYTQSEAFADNSIPYDFPDGRAVRNQTEGDLANTNGFQFGAIVGLRYHLPMNSAGTMSLVPEVTFSPMFTDVVSNASWRVSPLRLGLSVLFAITKQEAVASPLKP
mgnify:CR=1 FL=1